MENTIFPAGRRRILIPIKLSGGDGGGFWNRFLLQDTETPLEFVWKSSSLLCGQGIITSQLPVTVIVKDLQVIAVLSCLFVVVSTLCLIFSTLPRFQKKDKNGVIRTFILKSLTRSHQIFFLSRGGILLWGCWGGVCWLVHIWIRYQIYRGSTKNGVS